MKNIFGTDGIRDKFNQGVLTAANLTQLGHAIGQWAMNSFEKPIKILIGSDTRASCPEIVDRLTESLLQYSLEVFNGQILPTPVICKLVKDDDFDLGIIISASHNAAEYNGIKIVKKNSKLSTMAESAITQLYYHTKFIESDHKHAMQKYDIAQNLYQIFITAWFQADFLHNQTIVLDCAHGATFMLAPKLFQLFGANVITINNTPNGENINFKSGSTHLESLIHAVMTQKASWGIAFDGDGDRVMIINSMGQICDGDDILSVLTHHDLLKKSPVVGTIMSNQGLGQYLQNKNKTFFRSSVGDKNVYTMMQQYQTLLGGEPSGHIIVEPFSYSGDGIFVALLFLETILKEKLTLPIFHKFSQIATHLQAAIKQDLTQEPFASIIKKYENELNQGRLIVRYSGTEPILRIMVESNNEQNSSTIAQLLKNELESSLG